MIMEKEFESVYEVPEVEVLSVAVEVGFAGSPIETEEPPLVD